MFMRCEALTSMANVSGREMLLWLSSMATASAALSGSADATPLRQQAASSPAPLPAWGVP
jgi:hypothetical protein